MCREKVWSRILAVLLAAVMGISCVPVPALAQGDAVEEISSDVTEPAVLPEETVEPPSEETTEEAAEEVPEDISEEASEESPPPVVEYHSHEDQEFVVITSLPEAAGFYCLAGDVVLTENWTAPEGATLLCLNGHRVWGSECTVEENSLLILTDCKKQDARKVVTGTVSELALPEARTAAEEIMPIGETVFSSEPGSIFAGLAESVEKQVRSYAKSIDKPNADEDAAWELAEHGVFKRSKLKAGASHPLTATLVNSELGIRRIVEGCVQSIQFMQKLGETDFYSFGYCVWDDNGHFSTCHIFPEETRDKTKMLMSCSPDISVSSSEENVYDDSLTWIAGGVDTSVWIERKSATADTVTYDVKVSFLDRFDFSGNNGSAPADIASLVGSFLFREFSWESSVKFQLKVPNTCSHKMGNYHFTLAPGREILYSDAGTGYTYNHAQRMGISITYFKLDKAIKLNHDRPWVMEYTVNNPSTFILSKSDAKREAYPYLYNYGRGYLVLAKYQGADVPTDYYGSALSKYFKYNTSDVYTLRLENEVRPDKSNMVYLTVYNETTQTTVLDMVPMDDYYTMKSEEWIWTLQSDSKNMFNGLDLEIIYIGNRSGKLKESSFELWVWENGEDGAPADYFSKRITKPTCSTKGYTTYTCSQCGYSYQGDFVDPLPHTEVADAAVAPTCTKTGLTEGSHCDLCTAVVKRQETVAALGHEETPVPGFVATCLEPGLTEGSFCTRCSETVLQQTAIPALGHEKAADPGYAPTCTETGMTDGWHCGRCEEVVEPREVVPALGHKEKKISREEPNCEETGLTEGVSCSVCDAILIPRQEIPALGHTEAIDAGYAPSCLGTGLTEGKHCSVCGKILVAQEEIPALGHTEAMDPAVDPDCVNTGLTEGKHCSVCGQILIPQQGIAPLGHTPVTDAAVAPDCVSTGLTEGRHCGVCGQVLAAQQNVPALGHKEEIDAAVAPDCVHTGLTQGKHCSVCSEVLIAQDVVSALGHREAIDYAVAPDCVNTGLTEGKHCAVCSEVLLAQEVVSALGHTEAIDAAVAPTCLETGLTEGRHCAVCEEVLQAQEIVDALGHTEAIDTAVTPTCTETGLTEGKHCAVCGEVLLAQEVVEALGHVEVLDNAVAPSCAETGLTEGSHCEVCNIVFVDQEVVPALGHVYENGTCTRCQQALYLKLPQEHITLEPDQNYTLPLEISPADLREKITFTLEPGGEDVLSIAPDGSVTVLGSGTAWVEIAVTDQGITLRDRCRIDAVKLEALTGISLETGKITTQLFSTDYPVIDVLLEQETLDRAYALDRSVAIQSARFTDPGAAEMFNLQVLDDRSLRIVPTEAALLAPETVAKTYRSSLTVTVRGEEYTSESLTLTVKKTLPKLKARVEPFNSFYPDQEMTLAITGGTVTNIALNPEKTQPQWLTLEGDTLRLTEDAPRKNTTGKLYLLVETREWSVPAEVTVTVKNTYREPRLTLSAKTLTLNIALQDRAEVMVTAKDHALTSLDLRLTDSTGRVEKTGELDVRYESGTLTIAVTEATQGNYKLHISTQGSKETVLTVKTTDASPKVSFQTKGSADANLPRQRAELIPTFKNYSGGFTLESFTAETAKKQDVSQHFSAAVENGRIYVSCTEDAPTGSCTLRLKLRLADGGTMENTARVTVKRIPLKLKLSKTKVTLNKAISDRVSVAVTSATKGFLLDTPQWQLLDGKGKTTAEGALDVSWADGMLTIAVNDQTAFGATYKLQVRAKADAPTQTLTVGIPAESKSTVTSTLKAKGHIDVIRSDSALTLTKTYKNYAGEAALEEQLVFWKVDGKQKVDASHLFAYTGNEDGTFTVTQTGSLKPGGKYQAQLVTSLNGVELCRSKAISLTVKMGNAKLTLAAGDTTLFAGDKQDRAEFEILTGDPTLNGIARIEIKEKKYQGKVQLHSYSDGTFALSAPGLTAKTATVTLNIFLEGNETEKPNASLKLKITLQK